VSNYQAAPPTSSSAGTVVVASIDNDDDAFWNDAARQTAVVEKAFLNYLNSKKRLISPSSTDSAAYSLQTTECSEVTDSFSSRARKPKLLATNSSLSFLFFPAVQRLLHHQSSSPLSQSTKPTTPGTQSSLQHLAIFSSPLPVPSSQSRLTALCGRIKGLTSCFYCGALDHICERCTASHIMSACFNCGYANC